MYFTQNAYHWPRSLIGDDRMADLSFANDAGIQEGTGDAFYPDFVHKYMSVVAVSIFKPKTLLNRSKTDSETKLRSSAPSVTFASF